LKTLNRLIFNISLYGLAPLVSKIANIFILPFVTPHLTPFDYGVMGLLTAYLSLITVFESLGLKVVFVNSFFHNRSKYMLIWRQLFGFISIWSLVYMIIPSIVIYYILPQEIRHLTWIVISLKVMPSFFINQINLIAPLYFQLRQLAKPVFFATVLNGLTTIFITWYSIAILKMGFMGWIYAEFISSITIFIFYVFLFMLRKRFYPIFNFKWKRIKKSLKVSLPMIPHFLSTSALKSSDRLIMDFLNVSKSNIGLYSLAGNFENYVT
jgi:O-antigen/teichoic acid export membrane protein